MKTRPRAATGLLLTFAAALAGSLLLSWLPITQAQSIREKMTWVSTSNSMALCNDFTQAGFFIRRNTNSNSWVVFLESGGLCYDKASCNRRFFVRTVRPSWCYYKECSGFKVVCFSTASNLKQVVSPEAAELCQWHRRSTVLVVIV